MRRLLIAALVALLAGLPAALSAAAPAMAQGPAPSPSAPAPSAPAPVVPAPAAPAAEAGFDYYPIVVGLGALAGVVAFNLVALGPAALPGGLAYGGAAGAALVPAEMSVAMSRVYATAAAGAGGLLAYYLYKP